jgi:tetratricopeptide (TPR) repeat protein
MIPVHALHTRPLGFFVSAVLATAALAAVGCDVQSSRFNKLGMEYYTAGNYVEARSAFNQAITENPDKGEYYFNRGMAEQALGWFDKAIDSYDMAIHLSPRYWRSFEYKALCLEEKGDPKAALEALLDGTVKCPFNAESFVNVGKYYLKRGDMPTAKLWMGKGAAAEPENAAAHREYGFLLAKTGEKAKAATELKKSLDLMPAQPDVSAMLSELEPSGQQLPPPKPIKK